MNDFLRRWGWPIAKGLLALAILVAVGRQFYRDLQHPDLARLDFRWPWLLLSGLLYLLALALSAAFWLRLLHLFGDPAPALRAFRAYYIGHLGKYVPGKAWALLLRGNLVSGPDVRFGTAVLSSFYEVLTTMATGALVAAVVFAVMPPQIEGLAWHPALSGLLLLGLVGVPLFPGVFNVLVGRLARRFESVNALEVPRLTTRTLVEGIALTGVGWMLLGASLWSMLAAVLPDAPDFRIEPLAYSAGVMGLAYVAGFLAVFMPSGVGVREYVLLTLLHMPGQEAHVALAILLLRLVWTTAEIVMAAVVWPLGERK